MSSTGKNIPPGTQSFLELIGEYLQQRERLTVPVQTRLTPTEAAELDRFVAQCRKQGIETNRSAVLRLFVQMGLQEFNQNRAQFEPKPTP